MRIVLAALLATVAMSAGAPTTVNAQSYDPYAWCAEYGGGGRGGGTNCYFKTFQQCQWAISGNGGTCRRNLFYTGPAFEDDYGYRPRYRRH